MLKRAMVWVLQMAALLAALFSRAKSFAVAFLVAAISLVSLPAHAALDVAVSTALTTAFATLVTDATELQAIVMVPIIGILAITLVVKLVKRFGNKV